MTEYIYDTLGLIDLAARTAESISAEGIFICNSDDKVYALKEEAKKLNVQYKIISKFRTFYNSFSAKIIVNKLLWLPLLLCPTLPKASDNGSNERHVFLILLCRKK